MEDEKKLVECVVEGSVFYIDGIEKRLVEGGDGE